MAAEALWESTFLTQILTLNGEVTQCVERSETVFLTVALQRALACVCLSGRIKDNCRVLQIPVRLAIVLLCSLC